MTPAAGATGQPLAQPRDPRDWTYVPVWKQAPQPLVAPLTASAAAPEAHARDLWLLLADGGCHEPAIAGAAGEWRARLASRLVSRLVAGGRQVVRVLAGERFGRLDESTFTCAPGAAADPERLLASLDRLPTHIVHLWSLAASLCGPTAADGAADAAALDAAAFSSEAGTEPAAAMPGDAATADLATAGAALDRCFYSLLFLAQALGRRRLPRPLRLVVVTGGLHDVTGEERLAPFQAVALGLCGVLPRELAGIGCRALDLLPAPAGQQVDLAAEQILAETERPAGDPWVAFRHRHRFVRGFEPLPLPARPAGARPRLRRRGVCLITGGLGGIGLELAEHLARECAARLVLIGRSPLPERDGWPAWLAEHDEQDRTSRRIHRLLAIERLGGEVLALSADVADPAAVVAAVAAAERRFGAVNGVIHAAGVLDAGFVQGKTREQAAGVLAPKVLGALALEAALASRPLDFFVLASSASSALAPPGLADYTAANAFLDACAARLRRRGVSAVAIGWDAWRETGMAVASPMPAALRARIEQSLEHGLSSREGLEVFDRAVESGLAQVLVSTLPLDRRMELELDGELHHPLAAHSPPAERPRPDLLIPFVAPRTELERRIAAVWQEVLGVERVGLHDNFFELGGSSLACLAVVGRLKDRLQAEISEVSLYEAPTVAALAALARRGGAAPPAEAAEPAFQASRSRGERRRANLRPQPRDAAADLP